MGARSEEVWAQIEAHYRAGRLSVRAIADMFGVTEAAIRKRAKGHPDKGIPPWTRDLNEAVHERVAQKTIEAEAHDRGLMPTPHDITIQAPDSAEGAQPSSQEFAECEPSGVRKQPRAQAQIQRLQLSEEDQIELAAQTTFLVLQGHRKVIGTGMRVLEQLLQEMEDISGEHAQTIAEMIEADTANDEKPNRREALNRATSLPNRASAMANITNSMKHIVAMQREAFNMTANAGNDKPDPIKELLTAIDGRGKRPPGLQE